MLQAFAFDRLGVVISDLYFIDPNAKPGNDGPEQGVRVEVRLFERGELKGSMYSAQPISVENPVWRVDLLESVDKPRSLNRAHHHPVFTAWEPGARVFEPEMTADPLAFLEKHLSSPQAMLDAAGVDPAELGETDVAELTEAAPVIVDAVRAAMARVHAGKFDDKIGNEPPPGARIGWL